MLNSKLGLLLSILLIVPWGMGTLGKIYVDPAEPGDNAQYVINIQNFERTYKYADYYKQYRGKDVDRQRVTIWIPELGIYERFTPYDLSGNDRTVKHLQVYIPKNTAEGSYFTRIMVSNDHFRETAYTWTTVI